MYFWLLFNQVIGTCYAASLLIRHIVLKIEVKLREAFTKALVIRECTAGTFSLLSLVPFGCLRRR